MPPLPPPPAPTSTRPAVCQRSAWRTLPWLAALALVVALALAWAGRQPAPVTLAVGPMSAASAARALPLRRADFGRTAGVSVDAQRVADWVAATRDNGLRDFVIVDKRAARVYVFDLQARLQAYAPALLGAARGDQSVPGIGNRPIAQVLPHERTTPAGRFVAEPGINTQGEDVVWVDYDAAVSMHRVCTTKAAERRLERLASPGIDDKRISYGCINLPVQFYESQLRPRVHGGHGAVVYVLPEVLPLQQVFALPPDIPAS